MSEVALKITETERSEFLLICDVRHVNKAMRTLFERMTLRNS